VRNNLLLSADRALRALQAFDGQRQSLTVSEIASRLGVHRSTASRLAATLSARGFLARDGDAFRLGPEVARLATLAVPGRGLAEIARQPMVELADRTDETVTLNVRHGDDMTTIAQVDSGHVVGVRTWVGKWSGIHTTSDGKVMLAFGAGDLPEGPLEPRTERTITRRDALEAEIRRVRERGYATAVGEYEDGLNGVATPVFDALNQCQAALNICGPAYRVQPERLPKLADACKETASAIGAYLVGSPNGGRRES